MSRRGKNRSILKLAIAVAAVCALAVSVGSLGAAAHSVARASKAGKAYSTTVTYTSTSNGQQSGNETIDLDGHGSFSAKLGSGAKLVAAVIATVTGVPISKIAQGGTYKVQSELVNDGGNGIVVAHFKAHGLGTACLRYSDTGGTYNPSLGYVVVTGAIKMIGGTGDAAHWRGSASFKQNGIGGTNTLEQLLFHGAVTASTGKARGMSTACKHVAALSG